MIIPIFVPHEGCPNNCAFCDQHTISGQSGAPSLDEARRTIEEHLSTMNGKAQQIAFFGGSFTGIPTEKQNEYLSLAQSYIKNGSVESIRLSTGCGKSFGNYPFKLLHARPSDDDGTSA